MVEVEPRLVHPVLWRRVVSRGEDVLQDQHRRRWTLWLLLLLLLLLGRGAAASSTPVAVALILKSNQELFTGEVFLLSFVSNQIMYSNTRILHPENKLVVIFSILVTVLCPIK